MNSHAKVVTGTMTRRTPDLIKDGSMAMVVSEPPIVFGRAGLQYTVRLLNGDPMPNLVNGIMPYPVALDPQPRAHCLEHRAVRPKQIRFAAGRLETAAASVISCRVR